MNCPRCHADTGVVDTRNEAPQVVRRRRQCGSPTCGFKFTTYEIVEDVIDQEIAVTVQMFMRNGRLAARTTISPRCPCGKPAKYVLPGELQARYCRACNRGRGRPVSQVRSTNTPKG